MSNVHSDCNKETSLLGLSAPNTSIFHRFANGSRYPCHLSLGNGLLVVRPALGSAVTIHVSAARTCCSRRESVNATCLGWVADRCRQMYVRLTAQTLTCKTLHARAGRTRRAACRDARGGLTLSVCKRRDAVRLAQHDRRHTASCRVLRRVGRPTGSSCLFPWVISR